MLPVINALEVQKGKPAMKKNITELENPRRRVVRKNKQRELTIGVDLGDKTSRYCVLDREGNVLFERSFCKRSTPPTVTRTLSNRARSLSPRICRAPETSRSNPARLPSNLIANGMT